MPDAYCLRSYPCESRIILNQFFGGIGAEEHAGIGLEIRDGAVGPGKLLESLLGDGARVVTDFYLRR